MRRVPAWTLRWLLLTALAAVAVHGVRYGHWHEHAHEQGADDHHGYLGGLVPALCAVAVIAVVQAVTAVGREERPPPGRGRLWAATSLLLVAVYGLQELLEGHASFAFFGPGSWIVLVLAVVLGALVALLVRGVHAAIARTALRSLVLRPHRLSRPVSAAQPARLGIARRAAPRGPPRALLS
jgi:uncharacterized membrane protein